MQFNFFVQGPPRYTKSVLKKGDKTNIPKKGDTVSCWYTGTLEDGTVFDTNIPTGKRHRLSSLTIIEHTIFIITIFFINTAARKKKQAKPLSFKVGMGKVIRGVSVSAITIQMFILMLIYLNLNVHSGMRPFLQ